MDALRKQIQAWRAQPVPPTSAEVAAALRDVDAAGLVSVFNELAAGLLTELERWPERILDGLETDLDTDLSSHREMQQLLGRLRAR